MKNNYIIINKTTLEEKIEGLKKDSIYSEWEHNIKTHNGHSKQQRERKKIVDLELNTLEEILFQSTPLIPEIEKAFDAGLSYLDTNIPIAEKKEYIENLKLDV